MRVRAPLHSIDARGRFGSALVFSIWKGRNYAKQMTTPTNPQTARQMTIRAIMVDMTRAWGSLTDDQRLAWNSYAELQTHKNCFGEDVRISGFNEYVALAVLAGDMGGTQVAEPPITDAPGSCADLIVVSSTTANGEISLVWSDTYSGKLDVWVAGPMPAGRKASKSDFRHKMYVTEVTEAFDIDGLVAGGLYELKVRVLLANGQNGPYLKFRVASGSGF